MSRPAPSQGMPGRRSRRPRSGRKQADRVVSRPSAIVPGGTVREFFDPVTGQRWYEHVNLTGKDVGKILLWGNGAVIAACIIHAILFLPPYGLFYDGPARPGHHLQTVQEQPAPHAASQSVDSGDLHPDLSPSGNTTHPDAGQAQSSSDSPLFFDTDKNKDNTDSNSGDTSDNSDTSGASQSTTPPSHTTTDTSPPPQPDTPQSLDDPAAADLAHYYASVLTYSARTGDTKPLEDFSHPECKECTDRAKLIRDVYDKQGRAEQITYTMTGELRSTQAQSPDKTATFWFVHGQLAVSKHTITDLQSRKNYPASQTPTTLALCQHNNQWKICAIHHE